MLCCRAQVGQSEAGVRALLSCARGRIDLEIGVKLNNATAVNFAGFLSTFAILEALILAGADIKHRNDNGGTLLADIASNPIADHRWFELVAGLSSDEDINAVQRPRNLKWKLITAIARTAWRFGYSRSDLVMGMAHHSGATPLSRAAQKGNVRLVRWLLNNGALKSIHRRSSLGCTPLDASRAFGPHREASLSSLNLFFVHCYANSLFLTGRGRTGFRHA